MLKFGKDFIFGVSTSAYQIEGAVAEGGRSPSIWDIFSRTPGNIHGEDIGDVACDHYHRFREDVALMAEIGIDAYRFSISWPRIFPEKGKYNPEGMEFYKKLIDELSKKGIKATVTLYHWDMPEWLYEMCGGWLNRDSVKWFKEYAIKVFEELNDSVKFWITFNEPQCSSYLGYGNGFHAPGHKNMREALIAAHHILLSHGAAVEAFRGFDFKDSKIGIALNLTPAYPASDSKEDMEAAYRFDGFMNRWYLDPVFKASYPEEMEEIYKGFLGEFDFIKNGDLEKISIKNDFLGVNYYSRQLVKFSQNSRLNFEVAHGNFERTTMDWEIVPEALNNLILRLRKEYTRIPIYITENGAAFNDRISEDGKIHDDKRINYLREHLIKVAELNEKGANIRGYYVWSLIDTLEWSYGYEKRFGIIFVDYETQKRIFKDSALWYKNLIKERGLKET
ncbi:MAG: GH1 family beta-glucosidase [Actinobacteria bacterium]|nr:GH1 family beta-glucosidase [Actinomycetota bacterium]